VVAAHAWELGSVAGARLSAAAVRDQAAAPAVALAGDAALAPERPFCQNAN
jgi:hypothetical protein